LGFEKKLFKKSFLQLSQEPFLLRLLEEAQQEWLYNGTTVNFFVKTTCLKINVIQQCASKRT
jgi:hypothetical protein